MELYSIMGEYDNAGFPLSYCLLTTATAVDLGKRKKALAAWARCLRDEYGINPIFTHVDKDLGEIGALKAIWKSKVSLCWWHLRRAVRTRLGKTKLATTPYNSKKASLEFDFIDVEFVPPGTKVDIEDYEGGMPEDLAAETDVAANEPIPTALPSDSARTVGTLSDATNSLRFRLPPPTQPLQMTLTDEGQKENVDPVPLGCTDRPKIHGNGFTLLLQREAESPPGSTQQAAGEDSVIEDDSDDKRSRRTFCPPEYRQSVVDMLERHYCAHPIIPGYAAPNPVAIKRWAVQQMYAFCVKNELPELWAYLWENWYRKGRWELWARSVHELIPVLKTTMILESQ